MESRPSANTTKMTLNRPIGRPAPNLTKRNPNLNFPPLIKSEPHSGPQPNQNPEILFHKEDLGPDPRKISLTPPKKQNDQTLNRKPQPQPQPHPPRIHDFQLHEPVLFPPPPKKYPLSPYPDPNPKQFPFPVQTSGSPQSNNAQPTSKSVQQTPSKTRTNPPKDPNQTPQNPNPKTQKKPIKSSNSWPGKNTYKSGSD